MESEEGWFTDLLSENTPLIVALPTGAVPRRSASAHRLSVWRM
jgi:hypothetical protein